MPLTPDQQAAADALTAAFGKFMTSVGSTSTTPAPTPVLVRWHRPTAQETAAFASRIGWPVADLEGDRAADLPTTEFPNPVHPAIPPCDGTEEDAKLYAKFGFTPNGARPAFTSDSRDQYRALADKVWNAPSADAADLIVKGCAVGGRTADLDVLLICTGQLKNFGKFGVPELDPRPFKPGDAPWLTVSDAIAGSMATAAGSGPGPGGPR